MFYDQSIKKQSLAPASLRAGVSLTHFPDLDAGPVHAYDQVFCHWVEVCTEDIVSANDPFDRPQTTLITRALESAVRTFIKSQIRPFLCFSL